MDDYSVEEGMGEHVCGSLTMMTATLGREGRTCFGVIVVVLLEGNLFLFRMVISGCFF